MPKSRGATGGTSPTPTAARRANRFAVVAERPARAEPMRDSAQSLAAGEGAPSSEPVDAAQQHEAGAGGVADPNPHPRGSAGGAASGVHLGGGVGGTPTGPHPSGARGAAAEGSEQATSIAWGGEGASPGEGPRGLPPSPQRGVPQAKGPRAAPRKVGSGMNGGVLVSHRSVQAPQSIHNLGEALVAICTLTSFPPAQGTPSYKAWEARIKELTTYVQRRTDTVLS
jgi:hypothetical protein